MVPLKRRGRPNAWLPTPESKDAFDVNSSRHQADVWDPNPYCFGGLLKLVSGMNLAGIFLKKWVPVGSWTEV